MISVDRRSGRFLSFFAVLAVSFSSLRRIESMGEYFLKDINKKGFPPSERKSGKYECGSWQIIDIYMSFLDKPYMFSVLSLFLA